MPLVKTTLTAAIKAGDLTWNVASTATGFPTIGTILSGNGQPVMVDEEIAFVVSVPVAGQVVVRNRGAEGTQADAHDLGASVITSSNAQDFPANTPGASVLRPVPAPDLDTYGQDGVIVVPTQDTKAFIAKTTAAALTLGAPALAVNGVELVLTSQTAAAHGITTPGLLNTGGAGTPFNTATFPAQIGATLWLVAQNGSWNVANTQGLIVFS